MIRAFDKAYDRLQNDDKMDWKDPEEFKKELDNVKYQFDKLMLERKNGIGEKALEKHRKIWKERNKLYYE